MGISLCKTGRENPRGGRSCRPLASVVRCFRETKAICPDAHWNVIYFNWFTLKTIGTLSIIKSKMMEEFFAGCNGRMENHESQRENGAFRRASQQGNAISSWLSLPEAKILCTDPATLPRWDAWGGQGGSRLGSPALGHERGFTPLGQDFLHVFGL